MRRLLTLSSCVLVFLVRSSYAPVPRCSPFIIINKIPESSNFGNDFNPYFPVPGSESKDAKWRGLKHAHFRMRVRRAFTGNASWRLQGCLPVS